jgi:hypothetical protein
MPKFPFKITFPDPGRGRYERTPESREEMRKIDEQVSREMQMDAGSEETDDEDVSDEYLNFSYFTGKPRRAKDLDSAISSARWELNGLYSDTGMSGRAMIENVETGYRWFVRTHEPRIEMEPPDVVADAYVSADLSLEQAEALIRATRGEELDRRSAHLVKDACDELARDIASVRKGLDDIERRARQIHRRVRTFSCPACREPQRAKAKYCDQCGTALPID